VNVLRILLVSSSKDSAVLFQGLIEPCVSMSIEQIASERAALQRLEKDSNIDLVIHDQSVSVLTSAGFVERAKRVAHSVPLVAVRPEGTGTGDGPEDYSLSIDELSAKFPEMIRTIAENKGKALLRTTEYCPVRVEVLKFLANCPVDLYLRLGDEKYLKVLNHADPFSESEVQRFLSKGVEVLFIERKNYDVFSKALEQTLHRLSESPEKVGAAGVLQYCAGELYQELGFSPELEATVKQTLQAVIQSIQSEEEIRVILMRAMENPNDYRSAHAIACAYVSVGLLKPLDWDKDQNSLKLTLASLLHDLTISKAELAMFRHPYEVIAARNTNPIITEDDLLEFKQHPERSKMLAEQLYPDLLDVGAILVQHHERPEGTGFPRGLHAPQITPMSALFISAHEIVDFWMKRPDFKLKEFFDKNEHLFEKGSFKRILNVLKNQVQSSG